MNIVIIDDVAQEEFAKALKKLKHNPVHLYSADLGYDFILNNKYTVDLIFIDEELDKSTSKRYQSGTELGRALLKEITFIPLVMYTGTAYNPENNVDIVAIEKFSYIVEKGDFGKAREEHIIKIINIDGVLEKWSQKEKLISQLLKDYLRNLPVPKYKTYEAELSKTIKGDWKSKPLLIELNGTKYGIDDLLNFPRKDSNYNTSKIDYIIKSSKRDYQFQGYWTKPDKGIRTQLDHYWALPIDDYENVTAEIDREAFDYLLNVLLIKNKMSEKTYSYSDLELNQSNRKVCATNNCDKVKSKVYDNRFLHFKYKLIGRRVSYGYQREIGFSNVELFEKKHLAALLQKGTTNTGKTKKTKKSTSNTDIRNPSIFSSQLGIFTNPSNPDVFEMNESTVMFEEERWFKIYLNSVVDVRNFLDEFNKKIIYGFETLFIQEEFSDFTDFLKYYKELNKKCDAEKKIELDLRVKNYLDNNLPQPAIALIERLLNNP